MNEQKLQEKIKWKPFPEQQKILDAFDSLGGLDREIAIAAGTRFGKTALCSYIAVREAMKSVIELENWYKHKKGIRPKSAKIWVTAPTYHLSTRAFQYIVPWLNELDSEVNVRGGSGNRPFEVTLTHGVIIEGKTTENPKNLKGDEIDLVIEDECAEQHPDIHDVYIRPRLVNRAGRALFISTPVMDNWYNDKCEKLKEIGRFFHYSSWIEGEPNGFPRTEFDFLKETLPAHVFRTEYLAEFVPGMDSLYRGVDKCIREDILEPAVAGRRYTMGVDLGRVNDATVITVVDKMYKKVVFVEELIRTDYPSQKIRITAIAKEYNNARVILDATGAGGPVGEDLKFAGLMIDEFVIGTNQAKRDLVERLSVFIQQGQIFIPNHQKMIRELKAYGYKTTDAGNVTYSAPRGRHDDYVISLALAVWGLTPGVAPIEVPQLNDPTYKINEVLSRREPLHATTVNNTFI